MFSGGVMAELEAPGDGQQQPATVQDGPLDRLAFGEVQGVATAAGKFTYHCWELGAGSVGRLSIWHSGNVSMLNHRQAKFNPGAVCKRNELYLPRRAVRLSKPMEFPKGITSKPIGAWKFCGFLPKAATGRRRSGGWQSAASFSRRWRATGRGTAFQTLERP